MSVADLASGKGHKDENFPVASILIARQHRPAILAFYEFARAADDVADHATAAPAEKLRLLETMRATLVGESSASPEATRLREVLVERGLNRQHALDLLEAFRRDVTKLRYASWNELMDYCRYSAMPVGRFVLDVHGETRDTWPANDALCAALQVVNHLQDCARDYLELNRVYLPLDLLEEKSLSVEVLAQPKAPPPLREVLQALARRTAGLLHDSRPFVGQIQDSRLSLEVSVIQTLAEDLAARLQVRDPLCDRVHHGKRDMPGLLVRAGVQFAAARLRPKRSAEKSAPGP
jgi:squalene synthase HpnC